MAFNDFFLRITKISNTFSTATRMRSSGTTAWMPTWSWHWTTVAWPLDRKQRKEGKWLGIVFGHPRSAKAAHFLAKYSTLLHSDRRLSSRLGQVRFSVAGLLHLGFGSNKILSLPQDLLFISLPFSRIAFTGCTLGNPDGVPEEVTLGGTPATHPHLHLRRFQVFGAPGRPRWRQARRSATVALPSSRRLGCRSE